MKIADEFDVIVVGAGIGGYICSIKCAQLGLKTLNIEKEYYGGVCLNVGCIPTKSLLRTTKAYEDIISKSKILGIDIPNTKDIKINYKQAVKRKNDIVSKLTNGVKFLLDKNKVKKEFGVAVALDKNTIQVNGKNYRTKNLVIATGSVPNTLPLPGFDDARKKGVMIDSTKILSITSVPKSLTVIGGGVIGVEFGCLFASLGTKVTIVEAAPTILGLLDKEVKDLIKKEMIEKYKIKIFEGVKIDKFAGNKLFFTEGGKSQSVLGEYCLESVGRRISLEGFEKIGINLDQRKSVIINDYCKTNVEGVYAIGDVSGRAMLAHVAQHAAIVCANSIARSMQKTEAEDIVMDWDRIPSCIYTHPEIASIGKTEQELKRDKIEYQVAKFPFAAIGKAMADDDTTGFVKIMCDPKYKTILGAHIIGNRATDMISEITSLIECEGTISELARSIHPHPTMSEAIGEVAEILEYGKAINI
ncbi:dihydrolipoyl dehydrogenase [Spiroplasma endosymbiont of Aspidapion aeneum]|uniref:dihydrolipoyl dehydrogenase n=1 Tax=Spiroplasma endosymbiont of Aspidapion aeneum TaxID=3066276 RepID=UPI003CC7AEBF